MSGRTKDEQDSKPRHRPGFVTSYTEYGWDYKEAVRRSVIHRSGNSLLGGPNLLGDARLRALEGVRRLEPRLRSITGSPWMLGIEEIEYWREWLRKRLQPSEKSWERWMYPSNYAAPVLMEILEEEMKENFTIECAAFWNPQSTYNTVTGARTEGLVVGRDRQSILDDLKRAFEAMEQGSEAEERFCQTFTYDLFINIPRPWLPGGMDPEQIFAKEYCEECYRLQATKAGRKAKRLLLEGLTEEQQRDYWRLGYFFVTPRSASLEGNQPTHRYVVERGHPVANIHEVVWAKSGRGRWHWYPDNTYCLIAKEPHPTDDVILSQKLVLETDEEYFKSEAHRFDPWRKDLPIENSLRAC